jgi:60 kDa SS-A/Ro ribonucleoprotein
MSKFEISSGLDVPVAEHQVMNGAGVYVFQLPLEQAVHRFLVLGTESSSTNSKLSIPTKLALSVSEHGPQIVDIIRQYSVAVRAPKQDAGLFLLALCASSKSAASRSAAFTSLQAVCRIPTHLFMFIEYYLQLGGTWTTGIKKAVSAWYNDKQIMNLVFTVTKYKQRNGWSHCDLLRLAHPKPVDEDHSQLYRYITKPIMPTDNEEVVAFLTGLRGMDEENVVDRIKEFGYHREHIPTYLMVHRKVWCAFLPHMNAIALVRNLSNMQKNNVFDYGDELDFVVTKLHNPEYMKRGKIHPMQLLTAHIVFKGNARISEALEHAFYASFEYAERIEKRVHIALDVSGSMTMGNICNLSPIQIAVAMAIVFARQCDNVTVHGFSQTYVDINITPDTTFQEAMKLTDNMPFQNTNCALPMIEAKRCFEQVDVFIIITDNDTNYGKVHPTDALKKYRQFAKTSDVRLVVVATNGDDFTIADPMDPLSLDVVGFDASTPAIVSAFVKGEV